ncbi:carotenoid oxygenase family protein [Streptomyces sp. NPDC048251]|uniref:carotenoid oxygenase family protein n=1 Tax=Streptomyces sp. NPDC048251 TaxID=3154501 RepID=UPI0034371A21
MSVFPKPPPGRELHAPNRFEMLLEDVEVEGDVPVELNGTFYQVGPDRKYPPRVPDPVPFSDDGVVQAFRFDRGRVDFSRRYVQTPRIKREREAGEALYGGYRLPHTDHPSVADTNRGVANTNVLVHNGRLLALKEDSPPIAMDPVTLDTLGEWDFGGSLSGPGFTAHPKKDPETGQMIAFGFGAKGFMTKDVVYYEISPEGKITHEVWFTAPYYSEMHDFGVTRDYVVFPIFPLIGDPEQVKAGKQHFGWDRSEQVYLGVLPRGGSAEDLRWFKAPNQFASHVMNAFNVGPLVSIDLPVAADGVFPWFPPYDGSGIDPVAARGRLTRWTVDMSKKDEDFAEVKILSDYPGAEFPRTDDRLQMSEYRHGWMLSLDGPVRNEFAHVDLHKGTTTTWAADDPRTILQEPCFVPLSGNSAEAEGFLLQTATVSDGRSEVLIFDARTIGDGPLARLTLPLRLKPLYHTSWSDAEEIARPSADPLGGPAATETATDAGPKG